MTTSRKCSNGIARDAEHPKSLKTTVSLSLSCLESLFLSAKLRTFPTSIYCSASRSRTMTSLPLCSFNVCVTMGRGTPAGSYPGANGCGRGCRMVDPKQAGKTERVVDDHGPRHVGSHRGTLVGKTDWLYSNTIGTN